MAMVVDHPQMPASAIQLAGHATSSVVEGLTARSPWMLGIILLNVVGIASAVYFLNLLIKGQQGHLEQILTVQSAELDKVLNMHNREFDALMAMVKEGIKVAPPPPPPPAEPTYPLPRP
jgi:hypothetical protein